MDHNEFCCIFDASQYTGVPDTAPCPHTVDVPALIRSLDALYAHGREAEAESFLEKALADARAMGDWRGELSILSELLGQYRRSALRAPAFAPCRRPSTSSASTKWGRPSRPPP